jgi:hypothetical protein
MEDNCSHVPANHFTDIRTFEFLERTTNSLAQPSWLQKPPNPDLVLSGGVSCPANKAAKSSNRETLKSSVRHLPDYVQQKAYGLPNTLSGKKGTI